ncbi:hypothetical protein LEP1GSC089_2103 [Leptospira interrogans serovar Autumnalis str. LP101]|nr:hypothetical protein LEP1GSC089_2103 [Leptospira interrogans serovar Autumnalis str. LP101]
MGVPTFIFTEKSDSIRRIFYIKSASNNCLDRIEITKSMIDSAKI